MFMDPLYNNLQAHVLAAFPALFDAEAEPGKIRFEETAPPHEGDVTLVVFPFLKLTKKSPEESARLLGEYLLANSGLVQEFNVIKGFLNLVIKDEYWIQHISMINPDEIGRLPARKETVLVEYSSPNTNKPLHLGHVRNNVLGYALSGIYKANGYKTIKANLVNDRGIHICKSMLAWQKWGNGETPETTGMKGDHFVGKYYVEYDKQYKLEIEALVTSGKTKEEAEKQAPLYLEVQDMLRQWEAGDTETIELWKKMNGWVYSGFDVTYKRLGVDFDKYYYESDTYLLGKDIVQEGLDKNVFQKREDGSVRIDLTPDGLDEKVILRADGTSLYITQDLGTADLKYKDFKMDKSIYVVANEQDYHFKVLKFILQKLGKPYADGVLHFSYGMVDLPTGKMKSREGTVVDADDLMDEMVANAQEQTEALGKIDGFSETERATLYETIGLGALKFFLLRVDPKKRILFDPQESIDLHGYTGPFVQYAYARTRSIMRKLEELPTTPAAVSSLNEYEKVLVKQLYKLPLILQESCTDMNPARLVDYAYDLAKIFNKFYAECPILNCDDEQRKSFRIQLTGLTGLSIKMTFEIVGIKVPERM
jgi:arginyl-tRNA synthetase